MSKEKCHKCKRYNAEYNQTECEFCLGISNKDDYIEQLNKEIDQLNKVIDELEKYLIVNICHSADKEVYGNVYYKLQELKLKEEGK